MLMTVVTLAFPVVSVVIIWLVITLGAARWFDDFVLSRLPDYHPLQLFSRLMAKYKTAPVKPARLQTSGLLILFTSRFIAVLRYLILMAAGIAAFHTDPCW